jgi:phosphoglycolate phosphatase
LLFDLDGTLVDSARDIAAALGEVSRARGGGDIPVETVRPLVSLGAATLVARALGPVALRPDADLEAFRAVLRAAPSDPAIVFPGVERALAVLAQQGWRMAIVTNKPQSLAVALLKAHGLDRFFMSVVGGDTAAAPKPDSAPLRYALTELGTTRERALFVGDSDVDAAAAASLAIPLLVYRGGYGVAGIAADRVVGWFDGFDELPGLAAAHRF